MAGSVGSPKFIYLGINISDYLDQRITFFKQVAVASNECQAYRMKVFSLTHPAQRRRNDVVKTLVLISKTSQIGLKWKSRRPFFKTSSRRLSGDILKTSSRRRPQDVYHETSSRCLPRDALKTSLRHLKTSRLFLVYKKDHLETI